MLEDGRWTVESIPFPTGAVLSLYTDGVTEAQNEAQEFFEEDRLQKAILDTRDADAFDIHEHILAEVDAFVGSAPQFDDITLITIKRN